VEPLEMIPAGSLSMCRPTLFCLLAATLSLAFAPAPFPRRDRQRDDPRAINGTWEFVLWEQNGSNTKAAYTIEMTRDKFDFVAQQGGARTSYEMRLDPTQSPWAFEWRMGGQVRFVGSYRLRGDEMTMIFTSGNRLDARPTDFNGRHPFRFVLRRVKR
jgi:uncharacterized protein (TIGR03067 family)